MAMAPISKSGSRSNRALVSDINITPFVDVMLVLLVVFMVTAPMMISGINVNLPTTNSAAMAGDDEPLTITVTNKGIVYIQDIEIKLIDLTTKLEAITNAKKDSRILVRGDKDVGYGTVIGVIGAINQAGYNHISLVTQVDEKN